MEAHKKNIYGMSKWTSEEDLNLLTELCSDMDIETIANHHVKSPESINQRRKALAYKLRKKGMEMEIIARLTRLSDKEIQDFIVKRKEYISEKKRNGF